MKTSYILKTMLFSLALTGLTACYDDVEKADYDKPAAKVDVLPTITTDNVEVDGPVANVTLSLEIPDGVEVLQVGAVIDTIENASVASPSSKYTDCEVKGGTQSLAITGLQDSVTYYVRTFARVNGAMVYGEGKKIMPSYETSVDHEVDFVNENIVSIKGDQSVQEFDVNPLSVLDLRSYGYVNTFLDHNALFMQGSASIASYDDENAMSYETDLTGKNMPQVTIQAFNMCAVFGENYAALAGDFDVYISKDPISSIADLANAEKLGECTFPTNPNDANFEIKKFTLPIPSTYDGKCYITIYNEAWTEDLTQGNMGVAILSLSLESVHNRVAE